MKLCRPPGFRSFETKYFELPLRIRLAGNALLRRFQAHREAQAVCPRAFALPLSPSQPLNSRHNIEVPIVAQ